MPNSTAGEPRLAAVVAFDPETKTFAAWCDQLGVATSAPTEDEARTALIEAMRMAADFVLTNAASLGGGLVGQVPAAEVVAKRNDEELADLIHVTPDLRPD